MRLLDVDEEKPGTDNNAACLSNIGVLPDSEIASKNWMYFRGIWDQIPGIVHIGPSPQNLSPMGDHIAAQKNCGHTHTYILN